MRYSQHYDHYISYESVVEEYARNVLSDRTETFKEAALDGHSVDDHNSFQRDIDECVEIYPTPSDAQFVFDNCDRLETDRGLVEDKDPDEANAILAALTLRNDVYAKTVEIGEDLLETLEEYDHWDYSVSDELVRVGDHELHRVLDTGDAHYFVDEDATFLVVRKDGEPLFSTTLDGAEFGAPAFLDEGGVLAIRGLVASDDALDASDNEKAVRSLVVDAAIASKLTEEVIEPLPKGSEEERLAITTWLRLRRSGSFSGSYPLGSYYIDSRCGMGWDTEAGKFDRFDGKMRELVPHLRGKHDREVEAYYDETFAPAEPTNAEEMLAIVDAAIADGADQYELDRLRTKMQPFLPAPSGPRP